MEDELLTEEEWLAHRAREQAYFDEKGRELITSLRVQKLYEGIRSLARMPASDRRLRLVEDALAAALAYKANRHRHARRPASAADDPDIFA